MDFAKELQKKKEVRVAKADLLRAPALCLAGIQSMDLAAKIRTPWRRKAVISFLGQLVVAARLTFSISTITADHQRNVTWAGASQIETVRGVFGKEPIIFQREEAMA